MPNHVPSDLPGVTMDRDDELERLRRELEGQRREAEQQAREAARRGAMYTTVETLGQNMQQIRDLVKENQTDLSQVGRDMVSRHELQQLTTRFEGLSKWQWMAMGGIGLFLFLLQGLPQLRGLLTP
jgi:hypothetical protein